MTCGTVAFSRSAACSITILRSIASSRDDAHRPSASSSALFTERPEAALRQYGTRTRLAGAEKRTQLCPRLWRQLPGQAGRRWLRCRVRKGEQGESGFELGHQTAARILAGPREERCGGKVEGRKQSARADELNQALPLKREQQLGPHLQHVRVQRVHLL